MACRNESFESLFDSERKNSDFINRIHILSTTDRPNSNALKVATYTDEFLSKKAEAKNFSLKDFPLSDLKGGNYFDKPDSVEKFNNDFFWMLTVFYS